MVWIRRLCHAWKFHTFPQTGAESEVLWRLFEGYVKPPCDPRWLGSLTLFFCFSGGCLKVMWRFVWPVLTRLSALLLLKQKKLVCIFLFPVKPNTHLPSHTAPTLIDICDRSGTQLLHSELIFQIEFKWWSWCRINSVVQRPLRETLSGFTAWLPADCPRSVSWSWTWTWVRMFAEWFRVTWKRGLVVC